MSHTTNSLNFSNGEFSTAPRAQYPTSMPVRFYLNHFRSSTLEYVLEETGWDSITQFEDRARNYDMFTCYISPNGFLQSTYPQVDTECFRVFEFSLHHLKRDVLERLMYYYIGMNQIDYELQYPEYNTLYLAIPYYSWVCGDDKRKVGNCCQKTWQQVEKVEAVEQKTEFYDGESDSDTEYTDENDYYDNSNEKLLSNWTFKLNTETKNSYVLQPPNPVTKLTKGYVLWGDQHFVPMTWNLKLSGLERPLYWNGKYGGWLVSLKLKDALVEQGAKLSK